MNQSQDDRPQVTRESAAQDPPQQGKGPPEDAGAPGRSTTGNLSAENPRGWKPASNPHAGENIATRKAEETGLIDEPGVSGRDPRQADSGGTPQAFDEAQDGLQPETGRPAGSRRGGPGATGA